ncbi:hypothetical protein OAN76_02575 [Candidatus Marinimicrobia bacterium]|nr:hypothetical protein [Candidatus Neomarinimicrobiota bacterium]|tara:strand:- start:1614 stop:1958 length:345 start_codon:yes stop_codon:yes gene_type:complete
MATTWTSEGITSSGWTTAAGTPIADWTTQSSASGTNYADNTTLNFGKDNDFSIMFDTTDSRLEFNNSSGTRIASLSTTGLYLEQVNFTELSSLPSPTEGRMVYVNNEYYLGVGS